jgi:hypothetical protein
LTVLGQEYVQAFSDALGTSLGDCIQAVSMSKAGWPQPGIRRQAFNIYWDKAIVFRIPSGQVQSQQNFVTKIWCIVVVRFDKNHSHSGINLGPVN